MNTKDVTKMKTGKCNTHGPDLLANAGNSKYLSSLVHVLGHPAYILRAITFARCTWKRNLDAEKMDKEIIVGMTKCIE